MDLEPWSKANERDLARYVDSERIKLRLGVNRYDLARQPDGIRHIVEAIYDELLQVQIRYAPEKYFPNEQQQKIRSPEEILQRPGEGTCLDLALLFCGACLANDLLPMLIVIEGHALAAVSLTHSRDHWNAYDRHEYQKLDRGELAKGTDLIALIESQNYIAVECTGFAQSNTLPGGPPELAGREAGVLTFDQAIVVGRAQLSKADRPFQYALDIATLHELGVLPFDPVVAKMLQLLQSATNLAPAEAFAVLPQPQLNIRFDKLLVRHTLFGGREKELERLERFVAGNPSGYFFVTAVSGFGKTALLANWTNAQRDHGHKVCYHFISQLDATTDEEFALRNLCQQLAFCHRLSGDLPIGLDSLRSLYSELLRLPVPASGRIVVVLDGLDEAPGWVQSSLFPPHLGRGVFVVFSARKMVHQDWLKTLELTLPDEQQRLLEKLGEPEIVKLLEAIGGPAAERAKEPDFVGAVQRVSDGDPFYLRYLVEDIRDGQIDSLEALREQPRGLNAYLDKWWAEVSRATSEAAVRDLVGYLLVAKDPLSRDDLTGISAEDALDPWMFDETVKRVRRFVVGSETDGYSLCHPRFRDYIAQHRIKEPAQRPYAQRLLSYCARWPEHRSKYALAYYATRLDEAARNSVQVERLGWTEMLVQLVLNPAFQEAHQKEIKDPQRLKADLELAVRSAARDVTERSPFWMVELALELVALRQRFLPKAIFELAREGDLEGAKKRLELLCQDPFWRQAGLLTLAWLGIPDHVGAALEMRNRVAPELRDTAQRRLLARLDAALEKRQSASPFPKWTPDLESVTAILERAGGSGNETAWEPLDISGLHDNPDRVPSYLAEQDGPLLVAFAALNSKENTKYFKEYISLQAANPYTFYRNRSLAALVNSVLEHPEQDWVRDMMVELCIAALAGTRVDFREALELTWLGLQARAGKPGATQALDQQKEGVLAQADQLSPRRGEGDPWCHCLRRLAALAEIYAVALNRPTDAAHLLDRARLFPYGFAGFRARACLTLAEATWLSQPDQLGLILHALEAAVKAAHNIQDFRFCAPETCRVNAMQRDWWPAPLVGARIEDLVRSLAETADASEFAAVHVVGEKFIWRSGPKKLPIPQSALNAQTLAELAEMYACTVTDLARCNRAEGWATDQRLTPETAVKIPDRNLAPLLAARFAAEVLAIEGLPRDRRVGLIQAVVPIAAADPTALDTVLSRLILAACPENADSFQQLEECINRHLRSPEDPLLSRWHQP